MSSQTSSRRRRGASGSVLCSRSVECLLLTQFLLLRVGFAAAGELLFDFANETHDDSMCVMIVGPVGVRVRVCEGKVWLVKEI